MTYRELGRLADDYAVELASRGVSRGDLVPVLTARTPEFIATLLAILECGAAYAALDVRWPHERLTALVAAADAKILVTDVPRQWPVPVVAPPHAEMALGREPLRLDIRGDEPCAAFFTSGSSGTPKLAVTPHSGMVRLFADCDFADFGPGTVVPQVSPVSWDGFCLDCWGVLLSGGTSVFLDDPVLVPSTQLTALPLLSKGKLDQRALERLAADADPVEAAEAEYDLDPVETRVAALFGQLLHRASVPPDRSFFELGATSLDVARLCAKVDAEFDVAVPVSQVFATSTVRDFAAALKPRLGAEEAKAETAASGPIDLPIHYALALWEGMSEASDIAYLCSMAWWLHGPLDVRALSLAILDVHRRHEALHSRYTMDPGPVAIPSDDLPGPALELLPETATDAEAVAAMHAALYRPLSLAEGRIWRCVLVGSAESGRKLFGISVHHVAFDGASQESMTADLATAYAARLRGAEPVFAQPAETLTEIADTYRRRRAAADADSQIAYWTRELAGLPTFALPQRKPAEVLDGPRVLVARDVSGADMEPWDAAVRERGSTRLAALALAYGAVLRKLSGLDEFGILVPFSSWIGDPGRSISTRMDMLCLRMRPPAAGGDRWDAVGAAVGAALAAQDVSFAEAALPVLAELGEDAIGRLPVLLVENLSDPTMALGSCHAETVRMDAPTTMSELETEVWYGPDGGVRLNVAVWTDRLPAEVATDVAEKFQRVLREGPAALGDHLAGD